VLDQRDREEKRREPTLEDLVTTGGLKVPDLDLCIIGSRTKLFVCRAETEVEAISKEDWREREKEKKRNLSCLMVLLWAPLIVSAVRVMLVLRYVTFVLSPAVRRRR